MILWKIYDEHDKQHYVVLTYENTEPIKIGDAYVCHFERTPWLSTCWSDKEAKECNEPIKYEGIVVGSRNHHLRCYKVHSIIKTDSEWYAPFFATLSHSHDPENQWMTFWRADRGHYPQYDPSQDVWHVEIYPDPDVPEYRNGEPDFIIVHDEELRIELEVINPTECYTVEVNAIDWFLGSDYAIRKEAGNYNWED